MTGPVFIDWPTVMAVGFGRLRLSSDDFWQLTPKEFHAACSGLFGTSSRPRPLSQEALQALQKEFPDHGVNDGRG